MYSYLIYEAEELIDVISLTKEGLAQYKLDHPNHDVIPSENLEEHFLISDEEHDENDAAYLPW